MIKSQSSNSNMSQMRENLINLKLKERTREIYREEKGVGALRQTKRHTTVWIYELQQQDFNTLMDPKTTLASA